MLKSLEINGFKSFRSNSKLVFDAPISVIVGPNGSGKSNAAEAFRFVLGEQSLKTLRAQNSDDLLYNGGHNGNRVNRASVKAVFDNTSKQLDIEYSEVVVERIIQRGDASEYRINGSRVRLKDVSDLLSDANIGTSRHHIISQGEADRILNIHERERKAVIEDALGLRRFYQRRREALQKLDKTETNLSQVRERLRDLQPEVKYLTRQKKRIDETKKLRDELTQKYQLFFRREAVLTEHLKKELKDKKVALKETVEQLRVSVQEKEEYINNKNDDESIDADSNIKEIKKSISDVDKKLSAIIQELGEVTGEIQVLKRQSNVVESKDVKYARIENSRFLHHKESLDSLLHESTEGDQKESDLADMLTRFRDAVKSLFNDINKPDTGHADKLVNNDKEIEALTKKQEELRTQKSNLQKEKQELESNRDDAEKAKQQQVGSQHETEKELLRLKSELDSTQQKLMRVDEKINDATDRTEQLKDERSEARILCGKEALYTDDTPLVDIAGNHVTVDELLESSNKRTRRDFNRQLERLKIKLENTRVSDEQDILNEYERLAEQVDFLENEITDLQESRDSIMELVADIEKTVARKFEDGISMINDAFSDFFAMMFGGGTAKLSITEHPKGKNARVEDLDEEPDETERGVEISITLPNKKVSGLDVLSGGERSLVSIALLFSLSQINPPPFIVLDEADAALDEANSTRFGDMIEQLSDRSQLVIVTHNRETMARADILYGVTMDQSGGSRLLSLNFTEAMETVES